MKELRKKIEYKWFCFYWKIRDWQHCYIHRVQDCDNCKYFGGLMCDHVDADWNCLGWEPIKWQPIKKIKQRYHMKKWVRKMRKYAKEHNLNSWKDWDNYLRAEDEVGKY